MTSRWATRIMGSWFAGRSYAMDLLRTSERVLVGLCKESSSDCLLAPYACSPISRASASCVGCDLLAIPAQLHAAPTPRALLADVVEVQHTPAALAHAFTIGAGQQHRRAERQWGKQLFRFSRVEIPFSLLSICL